MDSKLIYKNNKNKYNGLMQKGGNIFDSMIDIEDMYKSIMTLDINLILDDEKFYDEKKPITSIFVPITKLTSDNITLERLTILMSIINAYDFGSAEYVSAINERFPLCVKVMYFLSAFIFFADQYVKHQKIRGNDQFIDDISDINRVAVNIWYERMNPSANLIKYISDDYLRGAFGSVFFNLYEIVDHEYLSSAEWKTNPTIIMLFNRGVYISSVYTYIRRDPLVNSMIGIKSSMARFIKCYKTSTSQIFTKDTCLSNNIGYCMYMSHLLFVFLQRHTTAGITLPIGVMDSMLKKLSQNKETANIPPIMLGDTIFLDNRVLDWLGDKLQDIFGNWILAIPTEKVAIPTEKSDRLHLLSMSANVIFEGVKQKANELLFDFCKKNIDDEKMFENYTKILNNADIGWTVITDIHFEEKISSFDDEMKEKLNDMREKYNKYKAELRTEDMLKNYALIRMANRS